MSNNLPCYDKATNGNYGSKSHYRKVRRLTERFEENREIMAVANRLEAEEQKEAFAAYQEMREAKKSDRDRDVLLYHCDNRVMSKEL